MKKRKSILIILFAIILIVAFSANAFASTSLPSGTDSTASKSSPGYVSPNPPGPGFTGWCIVTAEPSLTVRSGPGTTYTPVGSEFYGSSVDVIYVNNSGWAEISVGSNGTGWVSTSYLAIK